MRKVKTSPTIHVVGTLSDLLLGEETPLRYEDPGNPIVTVHIYGRSFPNTLVNLGATINILTTETCEELGIIALEPTTTLLELVDRLVVRPEGTLHNITFSVDSWEYPLDFLVINPKSRLDGHPLILGRPWLATVDAYIACREGSMIITKEEAVKYLVLYPRGSPSFPIVKICKKPPAYLEESICSPLIVAKALEFKDQTEDDVINNFINHLANVSNIQCQMLKAILDNESMEDPLKDTNDQHIQMTVVHNSKLVEIKPGKVLNINADLDSEQQQKLIQVLQKNKGPFSWDYPDRKGIDSQLCTHHIYTEKDARPIRQPQQRLNPHLKDIVKEALQKLLDVNFIYPISGSKCICPLVVVPKKNGKWCICVDY